MLTVTVSAEPRDPGSTAESTITGYFLAGDVSFEFPRGAWLEGRSLLSHKVL